MDNLLRNPLGLLRTVAMLENLFQIGRARSPEMVAGVNRYYDFHGTVSPRESNSSPYGSPSVRRIDSLEMGHPIG
jgi:hypothetical protein